MSQQQAKFKQRRSRSLRGGLHTASRCAPSRTKVSGRTFDRLHRCNRPSSLLPRAADCRVPGFCAGAPRVRRRCARFASPVTPRQFLSLRGQSGRPTHLHNGCPDHDAYGASRHRCFPQPVPHPRTQSTPCARFRSSSTGEEMGLSGRTSLCRTRFDTKGRSTRWNVLSQRPL
jgi:hypothetical protein